MKISDLVPNLYKNNIEMYSIINSEEYELETNLKPNIENSFKDSFANQATENGIAKYEKILNIKSDPNVETLKFRKQRVINRLTDSVPFTEEFLQQRLDNMLGKGNWSYTLDYDNYTLTINSLVPGDLWYQELLDFMNRIIPCNIKWTIVIYSASWQKVFDKFTTWQSLLNTNMTWQDVMDGEWI